MTSHHRPTPHRLVWVALLLLCQLVAPRPSSALKLRWSSGATALDSGTNTRAVLRVEADSSEGVLPPWWRLVCVSDSLGLQVVAADSLTACEVDTARASAVDAPVTPADSAANQTTAHFCSSRSIRATVAFYSIDLLAGSKGKLKAVALSPADPDSVIESNDVVYNGGVDGDYPPIILSARSTHATASLELTVVGTGLADADSVKVGAADGLWSVPLAVNSKSPKHLIASAEVPAKLPAAVVKLTSASGVAVEDLPADNPSALVVVSATSDTILYRDPDPGVYPHDFAFYYNSVPDPTNPAHPWKGAFHLFYIRVKIANSADSIIAHAWCDTLGAPWHVDLNAFRPSGQGWDAAKVWAPSIQQIGNLTYMFYTGVDALGNQSIGYATTPMLGTTNISWTRRSTPVYTAANTGWADFVGHEVAGRTSFRDPFVMPDPDQVKYPGRYLLFNAGEDRVLFPKYAIGVARNEPGTLNQWKDGGKFIATDKQHLAVTGALESPLVVRDSLTGAWRMFVANANYDAQGFRSTYFLTQAPGDSVTNTAASAWPKLDTLYYYTGNDMSVIGWQAAEHLQIGDVHYFASYVGPTGIGITRMHWNPAAQRFFFVHPTNAGVGDGSGADGLRFYLAGLRPRADIVRFALESEDALTPQLVIYDLFGRRVRNLSDGRTTQGRHDFLWDCRKDDGERVSTGMYFARLTGGGRALVVRVPILR